MNFPFAYNFYTSSSYYYEYKFMSYGKTFCHQIFILLLISLLLSKYLEEFSFSSITEKSFQ